VLALEGTQVTERGKAKIEKKMPHCHVFI